MRYAERPRVSRLLVIGRAPEVADAVRSMPGEPWQPRRAERIGDALDDLAEVDAVLLDLDAVAQDPLGGLARLREVDARMPVVVLHDPGDPEGGAAAVRAGAVDALSRAELTPAVLARVLRYAVERRRLQEQLERARQQRVAELERHVWADSLTGLWNRRYVLEQLEAGVRLASRHGHDLSLAVADLDGFRNVNDRFGHQIGDEVLRIFARLLVEELREEDVAGRFGGDQFCVLMPQLSPSEAAAALERIRRRVEAVSFEPIPGATFGVTATFGVSGLRSGGRETNVFDAADQALYRGKALGRNRVELAVRAP